MPSPVFVKGNSGLSASLAFGSAVTAGNTLIMAVRVGALGITGVSISDSVNGTWSGTGTVQTVQEGSDHTLIVGYKLNTAGGTPTVTASWTGGGSIRAFILEYSGGSTSALDGISLIDRGSTATPSTPALATSVATDTLVAILSAANNPAPSSNYTGSNPSSGWTQRFDVDNHKLRVDDVSVSSTGTYQEFWGSVADAYATAIIALKPGGATSWDGASTFGGAGGFGASSEVYHPGGSNVLPRP